MNKNNMTIKIQIKPLFSICGAKVLNLFILYDLGAEENILMFIVHRLTYSLSQNPR